jgi:hypothetical protein
VAADGATSILATFLGAGPTTTYSENIGVMAATRVYSTTQDSAGGRRDDSTKLRGETEQDRHDCGYHIGSRRTGGGGRWCDFNTGDLPGCRPDNHLLREHRRHGRH